MQHVEIQTAQNVALRYEIAGVGDRILAYLLDIVVLFAYAILVFGLLAFVDTVVGDSSDLTTTLGFLLFVLPAFFYHLICEVFWNGQSIGKKVRQIRVMRLDGREPTLGNYLLRWITRIVDFWIANGLVALVCILATKHSQRLGDLAAGTTVVSLKKRRDMGETIFQHTEADHTLTFPQVDQLTDADIEVVKDAYNLLVSDGYTPRARQVGLDVKAGLEHRLGVTTEMPPVQFARTVLRDYNHLHGVVE